MIEVPGQFIGSYGAVENSGTDQSLGNLSKPLWFVHLAMQLPMIMLGTCHLLSNRSTYRGMEKSVHFVEIS